MKKIISILLLFTLFSVNFISPADASNVKVAKSQLEVREIQTHVYDTNDKMLVFKAVINTLQDEDYVIQNIEDELGYIRAKREFKAVRIDRKRMSGYCCLLSYYVACSILNYGISTPSAYSMVRRIGNERSPRTVIVDSNVTIEPFGNKTRVRYTLIEKELENADGYSYIKSSPRKVVRIYAEPVYQQFFSELDKNIFYEKNL